MHLHSWREGEPELGDLVWEDPSTLHRGYLVVGVEETKDPTVWWLTMERLKWDDFERRLGVPTAVGWSFIRDRR